MGDSKRRHAKSSTSRHGSKRLGSDHVSTPVAPEEPIRARRPDGSPDYLANVVWGPPPRLTADAKILLWRPRTKPGAAQPAGRSGASQRSTILHFPRLPHVLDPPEWPTAS